MKNAIFLCESSSQLAAVYAEPVREKLRAAVSIPDTVYAKKDVLVDPARFADTEVIFSTWGMPVFTEEEIRRCFPRLTCVFYGAGTVQQFARPFLACGVRVFSAWAANAVPVAECTVAQIILSNKGFFANARVMRENRGVNARGLVSKYPGNYGVKVGLIGCGMIGSLAAQMLKGYDVEVLAYDPFLPAERAKELDVTLCSLEELFSSCQTVSNHLANNEATRGMLDYRLFSRMLPYATFLNTGRGAQVVEADLVRALTERPDLTAILDVTWPEPAAAEHPFYALPNCILTPHIAGSSGLEVTRMAEYMYEECTHWLLGEPCSLEVSEKMLATMA